MSRFAAAAPAAAAMIHVRVRLCHGLAAGIASWRRRWTSWRPSSRLAVGRLNVKQTALFVVVLFVGACESTGPTAPDPPVSRPTTPTRLTAAQCEPDDTDFWHRRAGRGGPRAVMVDIEFSIREEYDCEAFLIIGIRIVTKQTGRVVGRVERHLDGYGSRWRSVGGGRKRAWVCGNEGCPVSLESRTAGYEVSYRWLACMDTPGVQCLPEWPQ